MNDESGYAFANWSLQGDWQPGMTLRQYCAGQAMMGLRASEKEGPRYSSWQVAEMARKDADALLAELYKSNGSQKD